MILGMGAVKTVKFQWALAEIQWGRVLGVASGGEITGRSCLFVEVGQVLLFCFDRSLFVSGGVGRGAGRNWDVACGFHDLGQGPSKGQG